jgi:hypothetical protein
VGERVAANQDFAGHAPVWQVKSHWSDCVAGVVPVRAVNRGSRWMKCHGWLP